MPGDPNGLHEPNECGGACPLHYNTAPTDTSDAAFHEALRACLCRRQRGHDWQINPYCPQHGIHTAQNCICPPQDGVISPQCTVHSVPADPSSPVCSHDPQCTPTDPDDLFRAKPVTPDGSEDNWSDTKDDLIEAAFGLLCNVDGGNQQKHCQTAEWNEAFQRWTARYTRVILQPEYRQAARAWSDTQARLQRMMDDLPRPTNPYQTPPMTGPYPSGAGYPYQNGEH